jgi:hypothetical protein
MNAGPLQRAAQEPWSRPREPAVFVRSSQEAHNYIISFPVDKAARQPSAVPPP